MAPKKPAFGLNAVTIQQPQSDTAGAVPPPPARTRAPIDEQMERELSDSAEKMFPNALSHAMPPDPSQFRDGKQVDAGAAISQKGYVARSRGQREPTVNIFIRAPQSVADRFEAVMNRHDLRAKWDALNLLLDAFEKAEAKEPD